MLATQIDGNVCSWIASQFFTASFARNAQKKPAFFTSTFRKPDRQPKCPEEVADESAILTLCRRYCRRIPALRVLRHGYAASEMMQSLRPSVARICLGCSGGQHTSSISPQCSQELTAVWEMFSHQTELEPLQSTFESIEHGVCAFC